MKSEKFVPMTEDVVEEKERLEKGDPGSHFKTGNPYKRSSKENIPDSDEDMEEKMADMIDNKKDSEEEILTKTELLKQQIVNDIKKEEKIGTIIDSINGVASAGPDSYKEENKNVVEKNENESLYANMEDLENQPSFLSKVKYLMDKPFFTRRNKRERISNDKIKEVLHNSKQ